MVTAHNANMMGIKAARWNTSEKICATMPTYARMEPNMTVSARRYSGGSVSFSRSSAHSHTIAAYAPHAMKIMRHGATNKISWPRLGASTGTVRNTTKVNDITRAMWRPEYKSRITERDTVTLAAARPWTKRHARST